MSHVVPRTSQAKQNLISYNVRPVATEGSITDEGITRLRARIGIPEPHPVPPHYAAPGIDAFRHVAEAYGDDNPLWWGSGAATAGRR